MAWTTPKTWAAGDVPTAAEFNAHVRDNLAFLFNPPSARVSRVAAKSIATGSTTVIDFDAEWWDTDNMHDNATNNSRVTFNVGGRYVIFAGIEWNITLRRGTGNLAHTRRWGAAWGEQQRPPDPLLGCTPRRCLKLVARQRNSESQPPTRRNRPQRPDGARVDPILAGE